MIKVLYKKFKLTYSVDEFFVYCDIFNILSFNSNSKSISLKAALTTVSFLSVSNYKEYKPPLILAIRSEFQSLEIEVFKRCMRSSIS
jgi:hypothetical protein